MRFPTLRHPIVLAPMAGGPSTPALAAAVANAGGFGFLAAGYKSPDAVKQELEQLAGLTRGPIGVNLFVPQKATADRGVIAAYSDRLSGEAARLGVELGQPKHDDDGWEEKLRIATERRLPVVSFVFGCPERSVIDRLHASGCAVWITVTELAEAVIARDAGADALIVQGAEAGGHRGSFTDADDVGNVSLLPLLRMISREVAVPLVAAGGIADGRSIAAVLEAGARAAQIGTAFLRTPEAGTSAPHRAALAKPGVTALTRAFTGRRARGIVNRFMREHVGPSAYPEIHHLTAPLRAKARQSGDAEAINLWAGEAYPLAEELPAGELVRKWAAELKRS